MDRWDLVILGVTISLELRFSAIVASGYGTINLSGTRTRALGQTRKMPFFRRQEEKSNAGSWLEALVETRDRECFESF